ncbi:MAG: hypothetical protein AAF515_00990 [Pseudomonadota bacterium]
MSDAAASFEFIYRDRAFAVHVTPGERLALLYEGVVRKERAHLGREPLYVWTNVELEWEEHHYVEVRYWPSSGAVQATVNGARVHEWQVPSGGIGSA